MKRLIVNADDFGMTPGINDAVVELNREGALSSATLMAAGAYFAPAVHLAFVQTSLAVGCHVVLVDGSPVLPAREIPSLINPRNPASARFRPALGAFLSDLMRGRIREAEIEAETIAQIRRIQSSGLRVTHLDTHKHTHMFRRVLRPLLRAARQCEIKAVRNPFEPSWSLSRTPEAGAFRRFQVHALRTQRAFFKKLARIHGIATTDGAIGVLATGTLDAAGLRKLLHGMPDGSWELVCHPGYRDSTLEKAHTRLRASREIERKALLEVIPPLLQDHPQTALINFEQL